MKPVYFSLVVLACLARPGFAQVLDTLNADALNADILNSQIVDAQLINLQAVESQVISSQLVDSQLIDSQLIDSQLNSEDLINTDELVSDLIAGEIINADLIDTDLISSEVIDTDLIGAQLDQTVRDLDVVDDVARKVGTALDPVLEPIQAPLTAVAELVDAASLNELATSVPVLTRTGAAAFVDVKVDESWRAVEREWLIVLEKSDLAALQPVRADIIEQTEFAGLDMLLVRFRVPAQWDSLAALKQRLPAHLHEQLDRNHIYATQSAKKKSQGNAAPLMPVCDEPVKIGMIDTAINAAHPAFARNQIMVRDFLGEKFDAPRAHGTAVAGLLVGSGESLQPLLPRATLYAASVFYPRNQYLQGATMMDLVRALNWLADEKVSVINMSLAGPDNRILRSVIARIVQQEIAVIAAAGNEGPAAPPMYPAAYADVVAVTAVDDEQRIYRWANRGDYIDFAALGVSVTTARSDGGFGRETGTSIAAPVVSAFIACELAKQPNLAVLLDNLSAKVTDLGSAGRDPIFGLGLLDATQKLTPNVTDARVSE